MARLAYLCLTGALGQWWGSYGRRARRSRSSTSSYGGGGYSTGGYSTGRYGGPSYGGSSYGGSSYGGSSYGGYSPSYGGYAPQPQPRRQVRPQPWWRIRPQRRQQYYEPYTPPQPTYTRPQYQPYTSWQPQPTYTPPPPPQPTYRPPPPTYQPYTPPPKEEEGGYFTHTVIGGGTVLGPVETKRGFKYLGAKTRNWVGKTKTRHHQENQYLGTVNTRHVGDWGPTKEKSRVSTWRQISDTGYGPGRLIKRAGASMDKKPKFGGFSDNIGWTIRTGPAQAQQAAYEAPMPVYQAESEPVYGGYQEAQPVEEYSAPEPAYGGGY